MDSSRRVVSCGYHTAPHFLKILGCYNILYALDCQARPFQPWRDKLVSVISEHICCMSSTSHVPYAIWIDEGQLNTLLYNGSPLISLVHQPVDLCAHATEDFTSGTIRKGS